MLKPFRRPRLWLGVWCAGMGVVVVGSLLPAFVLPDVAAGSDKLQHFLAYALLAGFAVELFERVALMRPAIALVLLGITIELAQWLFTSSRMMDPMDVLANALGVLAGLGMALTPWRDALLELDTGH